MKKKIILEDLTPYRGFLSALNVTLLSILYLNKKSVYAYIGKSILANYAHTFEKSFCKARPFSTFFGDFRRPPHDLRLNTLNIGELWLAIIQELDWQSDSIIREVSAINNDLCQYIPSKVSKYISRTPASWPMEYDVAVHYRGCDYISNVPKDHRQNFAKEEFLEKCIPYIKGSKKIFVATDDNSFISFLNANGLKPYSFSDVFRGGPGKGVHYRSRRQEKGFEFINRPYLKGVQVLRDCNHLSRSAMCIGANSNLMYYAKVLRPEIQLINLHGSSVSHC